MRRDWTRAIFASNGALRIDLTPALSYPGEGAGLKPVADHNYEKPEQRACDDESKAIESQRDDDLYKKPQAALWLLVGIEPCIR
jgi:hypothetical protein